MIKAVGYSQTIVNDSFLFHHHDTVDEATGTSLQFAEIVELQREFMKQKAVGLRDFDLDKDWLIQVVSAHTQSVILPSLELTWPEE